MRQPVAGITPQGNRSGKNQLQSEFPFLCILTPTKANTHPEKGGGWWAIWFPKPVDKCLDNKAAASYNGLTRKGRKPNLPPKEAPRPTGCFAFLHKTIIHSQTEFVNHQARNKQKRIEKRLTLQSDQSFMARRIFPPCRHPRLKLFIRFRSWVGCGA